LSVIKLLNPLGWIREPIATGDGERHEMTIFDIPIWWLGEGFDIPDKAGLHKLNGFIAVIQLLFVLHFLGSQVLAEVVGPRFQSNNQSIDDGLVGVGWEVVACDGAAHQPRGHLAEGEEMVGGSCGSCGYWSSGSRSKESRLSGMRGKDPWLCWGELFKRRIDESGGSGSPIDGGARGFCGVTAREI